MEADVVLRDVQPALNQDLPLQRASVVCETRHVSEIQMGVGHWPVDSDRDWGSGTLTFNEVVALGHAREQLVEVLVALVARDSKASHRDVFRVKVELVALICALAVRPLGVERPRVRVDTCRPAIGRGPRPRAARARSDRAVVRAAPACGDRGRFGGRRDDGRDGHGGVRHGEAGSGKGRGKAARSSGFSRRAPARNRRRRGGGRRHRRRTRNPRRGRTHRRARVRRPAPRAAFCFRAADRADGRCVRVAGDVQRRERGRRGAHRDERDRGDVLLQRQPRGRVHEGRRRLRSGEGAFVSRRGRLRARRGGGRVAGRKHDTQLAADRLVRRLVFQLLRWLQTAVLRDRRRTRVVRIAFAG